jgi:hypothetical protein
LVKYQYLLRFVASLCLILYVPWLVFSFTIVRRSYTEVLASNEISYSEIVTSFHHYFLEELNNLKNHAISIGYDNSIPNSKIVKETIESHPYYYLEAIEALSKYKIGLQSSMDIGMYFYGTDYVLTSSYKYSFDEFLNHYSGSSPEQIKELANFFKPDNNRLHSLSTFDYKGYLEGRLYIGIPVTVNNKHRALVFYIMRHDSLNTSFFDSQSADQLKLCIFDNAGSLMYANTRIDPLILRDEEFAAYISDNDSSTFKFERDTDKYTIFKSHNAQLGNVFVSIVPQNQIEKSYAEFYEKMKNVTIFVALGSVLMLVGAVYVNYKPILKLVRNVSGKHGSNVVSGELDTITEAFKQIQEHVSEQEMMLMDFLLSNLLYGISIPRTDVERLDSHFTKGYFCVLTIADIKMDSAARGQLRAYILNESAITTYITDILYKNHTVLICVLEDDEHNVIEALAGSIKQYLYNVSGISYTIGVGNIVSHMNDIQKSYLNALYSMDSLSASPSSSITDVSITEDYPSEDIACFLQHVKNGHLSDAIKTLDKVRQHLKDEVKSVLLQRYICYDILTAYFKCLEQISYPVSKKETSELLAHNSLEEFYNVLSVSVKQVCESINSRNEDIQNSLHKQILEYLNNNYMDPDISRTQIADYFGISVYSLSRLIKELVGVGLTEYITA